MNYLLLYLFTRLDAINTLVSIPVWGLGIIFIISMFVYFGILSEHKPSKDDEGFFEKWAVVNKKIAAGFLICAAMVAFLPTQKDMLFIVGGKLGIDIAQSKEVSDTGSKLYKLLQKKLDEELKEEK